MTIAWKVSLLTLTMHTHTLMIMSIELSAAGVGVHHAGMTLDDRRATEDLFLKSTLKVVVCTSVRSTAVPSAAALRHPDRHWRSA